MPEAKVAPANKCRHSAEELSKIPFGPTSRIQSDEEAIPVEYDGKIAEYGYYLGFFIFDNNWVDENGYFEPGSIPEKLNAQRMKELEEIKSSLEKFPTITYVYCDGTSDRGGFEIGKSGTGRNPPRYNPKRQITLRAKNLYGPGMQFLYFEDENCQPVYKTPGENRGNIILWEVCRPLAPGEKMPMWSVS